MNPEPGSSVGPYELVEQIGAGGMGVVWKAYDPSLKRHVAIKILPERLTSDPEWRRLFQHEAEAAAALQHPNIAVIHQVGEQEGSPYIVMQFLDGRNLRQLTLEGPLSIRRLLAIATGIADGLAHASNHGVVHRDLKPDNVMVTREGQVKILDFGLAEVVGRRNPRNTPSGKVLGSRAYMSPEQIRGESTDHRSDLFALGVLMYEMAGGRAPFRGKTDEEIREAITSEEPAPLSERSDGIPIELDRIVRKAMEKEPECRYQHAEELATDLRNLKRDLATGRSAVLSGEMRLPAPAPRRGSRLLPVAMLGMLLVIVVGVLWWTSRDESKPVSTPVSEGVTERQMIVVLPFDNLGDAEDEYFAAGITQAITSRLATVAGLGVISSKSAVTYGDTDKTSRQIGDELGVDYVLDGSVRWSRSADGQSRVRIAPELIRASDDTAVWSDTYDEVIDDIFALESRIADTVIDRIGVAIGNRNFSDDLPPTENLDAYRVFLQAQQLSQLPNFTEVNFRRQLELLEQAIELDPEFAVAYALLSRTHSALYHFGHDRTTARQELAKATVERALELDPESPEVHFALGNYYYWCHKDYERALEAFAYVQQQMPSNLEVLEFVGFIRRRQGRWEEAATNLERAITLNPVDANLHAELGSTFSFLGRYDDALGPLERAIDLLPEQPTAHQEKVFAHWLLGDFDEAHATLEAIPHQDDPELQWYWFRQYLFEGRYEEAVRRLESSPVELIYYFRLVRPKTLLLGELYDLMGRPERGRLFYETARRTLEDEIGKRPDDYRLHSALGLALAGLDRPAEAVAAGEHAVEMYPVSRDAVFGPRAIEILALIHARNGESERAIDRLEQLFSMPSLVSGPMIAAEPRFAPLRSDPRFAALVARRRSPG